MKKKKEKDGEPIRRFTKAPPPPRELGGRGWMPPGPKATRMPSGWPPDYPNDLKVQTTAIIVKALREFTDQSQTLELCKYVIRELTPHFCGAVRGKTLRADLALSAMTALRDSLLLSNCDDSSERFRLEQELDKSDEWQKFAEGLVAVAKVAGNPAPPGAIPTQGFAGGVTANPPGRHKGFEEYPKMVHHLNGSWQIVYDSDQQSALGREWFEQPDDASAAFDSKARPEQLEILSRSRNPAVAIDRFYGKLFDSAPEREQLQIVREYRDEHPRLAINSEWAKPYLAHLPPVVGSRADVAGIRLEERKETPVPDARATMAEDDPRGWSLLRQHLEAEKIHKRLISGRPHQTLSEAFLRNVLAEQFSIKPEDVTKEQMMQAVGDLQRDDPSLGAITVVLATASTATPPGAIPALAPVSPVVMARKESDERLAAPKRKRRSIREMAFLGRLTPMAVSSRLAAEPQGLARPRRERGPDLRTSRERVALEDKLRAELGSLKDVIGKRYSTLADLKKEFPNFELWNLLSKAEQEELLTEEFKPRAYARSLAMRKYGLTSSETIKKDRQKLRRARH